MIARNFASRTLWTGDNLDILRGMNSATFDLIYLDPPFNSNRDYAAPVGSEAAGAAFKDTWDLSDLDVAWMGLIADEQPAIAYLLDAAGRTHSEGMQSYLTMMAVRLLELNRVLKPEGSIFLHCDSYASHYLKMLMDAVFGQATFWTDITWQRTSAHNDRLFGSVSDSIIAYGGDPSNLDAVRVPLTEKNVSSKYRYTDSNGRYRTGDLTGAGTSNGESGLPWKGHDPGAIGRHWSAPKTGRYANWLDANLLPGYLSIRGVHDRLDALDQAGMIHPSSRGGMPALKRYLTDDADQVPGNVWTDIPLVNSQAKERTHFPTQKPLDLLARITNAGSPPGGWVLDPFCGCATACVAAELAGRNWVGIDISPKAAELVNLRLKQQEPGIALWANKVINRTDIPQRDDIDAPKNYRQNKHILFGQQEGRCNGCVTAFEFRHFHVDHVIPQAKGGTDHIENLQLLCGHCNSVKGDRDMAYLKVRLKELALT